MRVTARRGRCWGALVAAGLWACAAAAEPAPLIPRELLFGNPDLISPKLSPDGKQVGWLAPDAKGVLQLWVQPMPVGQAVQITTENERPILRWAWAEDNQTLLFLNDGSGDENFHVFTADVATRATRDLTPWKGVRAELLGVTQKVPDAVLVMLNQRDRTAFDVHRINLKSGAVELDTRNPGDVVAWLFDDSLTVRAALARTPDGGSELRVRDSPRLPWRTLVKTSFGETITPLGFALDGKGVFLATTVGADTTRVIEKNVKSGTERQLAFSPTSDLREWIFNPWKFALQAAAFEDAGKLRWVPIEPSVVRDLELLAAAAPGVFRVTSRDRADALWLVEYDTDRDSKMTWLWDRAARKATLLFNQQPRLGAFKLAEMKPLVVTARDGLALPALLTLPVGAAPGPLPLVLSVHGGPWAADTWGFDPRAQFFANRGYAVLQVNFRGSAGFGKRFLNAGNREWGRRMQDDLTDAVAWAVKEGLADPKRVAIFGRNYGGYAALAGLTLTPELYRCAIDGSGPVDLNALVRSFPPWATATRGEWEKRLGNPDVPTEKARLEQASPLFLAERIQAPLLIAHGANDPRVKAPSVQQFVARLDKAGQAYTFVQYADEGPNTLRPQNSVDFFARTEAFLKACLGGRAEPWPKDGKFPGSSATVTTSAPRPASTTAKSP